MSSTEGKIRLLDDLVSRLGECFEQNKVDVDDLMDLMSNYISDPKDWTKYATYDPHRYTRNLVDTGNGRYNLMIICWSEGQGSSIHDHPGSHCVMKILSGTLSEVRFAWPSNGGTVTSDEEMEEMKVIGRTDLTVNQVAYMNDELGLHRMENMSHALPAVSLHLYVPPYESCRMFDQRTGHSSKCTISFQSVKGTRIKPTFGRDPITGKHIISYENN